MAPTLIMSVQKNQALNSELHQPLITKLLEKPIEYRMSSNQYPEPPKLTSAKTLMKQKVQPKLPVEETVKGTEQTTPELGSIFPTVPVVPQKTEPVKDNDVTEEAEISEITSSPLLAEEVQSPLDSGEIAGNPEGSESEEAAKETHGDPWGIIKHTGYVTVAVWAALTAAVTGAAAYFFAPGDYTWIPLAILGFMTGVIAAVDRKTHLIKNQHTIVTAIVTAPLAAVIAFTLNPWNVLFGILAAVVVFGVFIFLILKVNFGSGGDIKFSPVPAFALGVVNPLISALWLFYALIITVILLIVRKQKATSFGEGMAISLPLAIASVYALYSVTGLPYMDSLTP